MCVASLEPGVRSTRIRAEGLRHQDNLRDGSRANGDILMSKNPADDRYVIVNVNEPNLV